MTELKILQLELIVVHKFWLKWVIENEKNPSHIARRQADKYSKRWHELYAQIKLIVEGK